MLDIVMKQIPDYFELPYLAGRVALEGAAVAKPDAVQKPDIIPSILGALEAGSKYLKNAESLFPKFSDGKPESVNAISTLIRYYATRSILQTADMMILLERDAKPYANQVITDQSNLLNNNVFLSDPIALCSLLDIVDGLRILGGRQNYDKGLEYLKSAAALADPFPPLQVHVKGLMEKLL